MDIFLMGNPKAGRSSFAKVIFQKMSPNSTLKLHETLKRETYAFVIHTITFKVHDIPAKQNLCWEPSDSMAAKRAAALIYMVNPEHNLDHSMEEFDKIVNNMRNIENHACSYFIFVNKIDLELSQEGQRKKYEAKLKTKVKQLNPDLKFDLFFTSVFQFSCFHGFSEVLRKVLPCAPHICSLLKSLSEKSKLRRVYLFDLMTRLYIAEDSRDQNDTSSPSESIKEEICTQILEVLLDVAFLYGAQSETDSKCEVRLSYKESDENSDDYIVVKTLRDHLALVFIVKDTQYAKSYLVNNNIAIVEEAIHRLMDVTKAAL